jgi:hypothetical protein
MIQCTNCGKDFSEESAVYCDMCGPPLCKECGNLRLWLTCAELWEAEIDLEDIETEGE